MTEQEASKVVAFKYQDGRYCKKCFESVAPLGKTIAFGTLILAVALLSEFHYCDKCKKDLREE